MATEVHVFDADAPPTLACVRSLARAGARVHVHSPRRVTVAGASRYAATTSVCPPSAEPEAFLAYLRDGFTSGRIQAVAPTSDGVAFALAELADVVPAALARVLPSPAAVRQALFKHEFDGALNALGFGTPKAFYPNDEQRAAELAATLTYPVVLKPRSHIGVPNERGVVVHNVDELRQHFHRYGGEGTQPFWLERYVDLQWPLIQEYVPDALDHLYSISGFIAPNGEVLAVSASHKVSQWPPKLGVGTVFEAWADEQVIARGVDLAKRMLGCGLFELELIYDGRAQDWLAIDLNPRAFGQMTFDIARGLDLPRLWLQAYEGAPTQALSPHGELLWIHSLPFHIGSAISLVKGPSRWSKLKSYGSMLVRKRVDIVSEWADPLPSVVFAAKMLRHPGGLIRPLWKET